MLIIQYEVDQVNVFLRALVTERVMILCFCGRIQNAFAPHNHVFALVVLACLSAPLHGALNALVFGMDRETLKKLTPMQIMVGIKSYSHVYFALPYMFICFYTL